MKIFKSFLFKFNYSLLSISLLISQGCINLGPSMINENRNSYNSIIQRTNDEQLLLNLVRLKFHETPLFLEIANVTSQHRFQANVNADATFPNSGFNIFEFGGGTEVSENPVITYAPLQGQKFIQQFLAKIKLNSIYLLYKSGWTVDKVLRLCVEKMGPMDNAPNASGPTPKSAPIFEEFLMAANLFRKLEKANNFNIFIEEDSDSEKMVFKIPFPDKNSNYLGQLNKLFKKPVQNDKFSFRVSVNENIKSNLDIETRSLLGVLYYLSHAIETTKENIESGYVVVTLNNEGKPFLWGDVTGDLLKIYSQIKEPSQASIKILYDGHWYFVKKSDLNSKSTFSFLAQIFFLQAGNFDRSAPLITIPIGNN